jgi:dTDP-4-amino-4,6-dideoxygalactose transaminase
MLNTPFNSWPRYSKAEGDLVKRVLMENEVNYRTGDKGYEFELEFAGWVDSKYAVSVANGTVALDLAMVALDIGPGDDVIVSPRTFIASVSTIITAGAFPVFADVDLDSQNITVETIKKVITKKTKAIICVHHAGWPCEMDAIMSYARKNKLKVIEDCAQAHGAIYRGRSVGSIGDIGAWSFCQDKIMTTGGEGGMVTTNNMKYFKKMWSYRDHGKKFNPGFQKKPFEKKHSSSHWPHESFGTNWRMTEIQAALGSFQLKKMKTWSHKRQENARQISASCDDICALRVPKVPEYIEHACYKHYVFVQHEKLNKSWTRDRIMGEINKRGVPCFSGGCPEVYREPAFKGTKYALKLGGFLPNARKLGTMGLMFMVHPTLTKKQISKTCKVIKSVMADAME